MSKIVTWWGFRLRHPSEFSSPTLSRPEITALLLSVAIILQIVWMILVFSGLVGSAILDWYVFVSPAIVSLAVVLGVFLPAHVREQFPGSFWFMLAREKGRTSGLDLVVAITAFVSLLFALQTLNGLAMTTSAFLFGSVMALSVCLKLFQKNAEFSQRSWKIKMPEWIRAEQDETRNDDDTLSWQILGGDKPDQGASPVYVFNVRDRSFNIGVNVLDNLLKNLQQLNADSNGRLYQIHPDATVLADREPVTGLGQKELLRFCRQLYFAFKDFKLTPLQIANLILNFVQESFSYKFDIDSTHHVVGGPYEEYGRFPLETINDQHGDCECTAILCASLLTYLGFNAALLFMEIEEDGELTGHCAVGLSAQGAFLPTASVVEKMDYFSANDGSLYLYGETATDTKMGFGTIPDQWKNRLSNKRVVEIKAPNILAN